MYSIPINKCHGNDIITFKKQRRENNKNNRFLSREYKEENKPEKSLCSTVDQVEKINLS